MNVQNLAKVLLYHRKRAGLSRVELASLAGVGKTAVYDIEHGKESIQLDTLLKIMTALNLQLKVDGPLINGVDLETFVAQLSGNEKA